MATRSSCWRRTTVTLTPSLPDRARRDVNRPNDKNQTPLAGAVFKGEDAVVKALVSGGADPKGGHPTAVDAARMFGREDYLSLLES